VAAEATTFTSSLIPLTIASVIIGAVKVLLVKVVVEEALIGVV
jgi:hypothetical protein